MKFAVRIILFLSIIVWSFSSCKKIIVAGDAHVKASWIKVLPDSNVTAVYKYYQLHVAAASDGGMYIPLQDANYEIHIDRLDAKGNLLWKKKLTAIIQNVSIIELNDHSLFAIGPEPINDGLYWYKISPEGELIDSAEILFDGIVTGTINYLIPCDNILVRDDGTLTVYGFVHFISTDGYTYEDVFTCVLNSSLQKIYSNAFVVNTPSGLYFRYFYPRGLHETSDGKLLMSGDFTLWHALNSPEQKNTDGLFTALLNADGSKINSKYFTTGYYYYDNNTYKGYLPLLSNLYPDGGGGNFISTLSPADISNYPDINQRIITFDSLGNIIDSVKFLTSLPQLVSCTIQKTNGDFLMTANDYNDPYSFLPIKSLGHFISASSSGVVLQMKSPESGSISFLTSCCKLSDGKYAAMGFIQPYGKSYYNLVVIKTDANGYY